MISTITVDDYRALWSGAEEFALIDPREPLDFGRAHLFAATNMPLSRLELLIEYGVPNRETRIVLCDDADGSAARAATVLGGLGYSRVEILAGGLPRWQLGGGAVFSGVNVPSKAFGEAVEHALETPSISAAELHAKLASDEDFLLLDSRPMDEHSDHCIPGSISCPSAEMILRAAAQKEYWDKDVIVHCAGRTRAIIGAQTLIDSGLFRSVRSLWNGTPAWGFERFELQHGDLGEAELPDEAPAAAIAAAERIAGQWSIPSLDANALSEWREGLGTRYLIDVRSAEEFAQGHLAGAKNVPGGQLLQTADEHLVVQNAAIALVDSDGVRAVTTAMWLRRMGWAYVVTYRMNGREELERADGPGRTVPSENLISIEDALSVHSRGHATFCDLRPCHEYRRSHIAGAWYLTRARLSEDLNDIPESGLLILVADELAYAELIRHDLASLGREAKLLEDGLDGWAKSGGPLESGLNRLLSRPDDTYPQAEHFDDVDIAERENRAYLNWEIALIDHLANEPAARFELN